ncbi:hypothetical protein SYNGFB01_08515, partial [Synechococcus sp. GFB01]
MPCLAKSPFSRAMISGAESVRAMKPRVAPFTSGARRRRWGLGRLELSVWVLLPPQAASHTAPAAEPAAVSRNLRRERFDMGVAGECRSGGDMHSGRAPQQRARAGRIDVSALR